MRRKSARQFQARRTSLSSRSSPSATTRCGSCSTTCIPRESTAGIICTNSAVISTPIGASTSTSLQPRISAASQNGEIELVHAGASGFRRCSPPVARRLVCDHCSLSLGGTVPLNDCYAFFEVKELLLSALEPMVSKHFFWSLRRYSGEYWQPARQTYGGRARQIKDVITVQKYSENFRSPNHTNAAVPHP